MSSTPDLHVVSLTYKLTHGDGFAFDNPPPVDVDREGFRLRLDCGKLVVTMQQHFATEREARAAVEPTLRAWEIDAGLRFGPRMLSFDFERAEVVDRSPPRPDGVRVGLMGAIRLGDVRCEATGVGLVRHASYPAPPTNFVASEDVQTMWSRYRGYLEGKETLLAMAYACLSFLEGTTGKKGGARREVCAKYNLDDAVRKMLGDLTSQKGSPTEARKLDHEATRVPLTDAERRWVEDVIVALIRRKAEYDAAPSAPHALLTMNDFPPL